MMKIITSLQKKAFRIIEKLVSGNIRYGAGGDFSEYYYSVKKTNGSFIALLWLLFQLIHLFPSFIFNSLYGSTAMFNNYLKTALRNMKRLKGYSFLNSRAFNR